MTTVSSHPGLSNSLASTEGRCADLSNPCQHEIETTQRSPDVEGNGDDLVIEDEEIASVEADGTCRMDVPDDGGSEEKQLLTAALVTSVVDFVGSSPCGGISSSSISNHTSYASGTKGAGAETRRRSLRKRPREGTNENEHVSVKVEEPVETLTLQAKSGQDMYSSQGQASNPSPVPNPLTGMQESTMSLIHPTANLKSEIVTMKTNTLMSAAPDVLVPDVKPPSSNVRVVQFGGKLANIAESMSSEIDVLPTSNVSVVAPQKRGRIFSIDLDPAVLDFIGNVVDPLSVDKADISTNEASGENDDRSDTKNLSGANRAFDNSSRVPLQRDRGFSFDFFSFGGNEDEPLLPVSACGISSQGNRLRGDSIIFDPTSFLEGGIHETSALLHIKQENEGAMHAGIPSASVPHESSSLVPLTHTLMTASSSTETALLPHFAPGSAHACKTAIKAGKTSHPKPRGKGKYSQPPLYKLSKSAALSTSKVAAAESSRTIPQAFSDNTIHMPHGSDAAAAAAAGMPQTDPSPPNDGFSLSHTACPMELLNKGGRIGIYLPDERKARIAKFHSKRKMRIWRKRIKYDCRKKLADKRPRVKGRFVKRSDVDADVS